MGFPDSKKLRRIRVTKGELVQQLKNANLLRDQSGERTQEYSKLLQKRDVQLSELLDEKTQLAVKLDRRPTNEQYDALHKVKEETRVQLLEARNEVELLRKQIQWISAQAVGKLLGLEQADANPLYPAR